MFRKDKPTMQSSWSDEMKKSFISTCLGDLSASPGKLPLFIKERQVDVAFKPNKLENDISISYRGFLARPDLENVYFALSTWDAPEEEDKKYVGYVELLNGITDQNKPVPMIRGFIRRDIDFFETVDCLLRDARIFGKTEGVILNVQVDYDQLYQNLDSILNNKIVIKYIEAYQHLSIKLN